LSFSAKRQMFFASAEKDYAESASIFSYKAKFYAAQKLANAIMPLLRLSGRATGLYIEPI